MSNVCVFFDSGVYKVVFESQRVSPSDLYYLRQIMFNLTKLTGRKCILKKATEEELK